MARKKSTPAQLACEAVLAGQRQYNSEHKVLPSTIPIYDRVLARGTELSEAYEEVHEKLHAHPRALEAFFTAAVEIAAYWTGKKNAAARAARATLVEVNQAIYETASALADLLRQRSELRNTSGFTCDTLYSICELIDVTGQSNGRYRFYLGKEFRQLRAKYDLKYWPKIDELLVELAADAGRAEVQASDSLTAAATEGTRTSKTDYFKALFKQLAEDTGRGCGPYPAGFKLKDETLASLANCILDPPPGELMDAAYVKSLRQRMRRR